MPKIIKSTSISEAPIVRIGPAEQEVDQNQEANELGQVSSMPPIDLAVLQEQADALLRLAQQEAVACRTEAETYAESLQQEARQQGYEAGYQEGFQNGVEAATKEMQAKVDQATKQAANILSCAEEQSRGIIIGAERQIIDIAMTIARKILSREIEENPMVVLPIVTAALDKVRDQEQIKIRVHSEDYELVLQARRDLQMLVGREQGLQIVADPTISSGGCIIDTAYGSVDARVDTQLDSIRKALEEVLP